MLVLPGMPDTRKRGDEFDGVESDVLILIELSFANQKGIRARFTRAGSIALVLKDHDVDSSTPSSPQLHVSIIVTGKFEMSDLLTCLNCSP